MRASLTGVPTVRLLLLLASLCVAVTACSAGSGGGAGDDEPADVQQRTTQRIQDAVPLALTAVSGTKAEVHAQWRACMPELSYQYQGDGLLTAPEDRDANGIEDIRSALVDAGYSDVSQVAGHVTVKRDGVTLDVRQPGKAHGPGQWRVSFHTECFTYGGDDEAAVEGDDGGMVPGLVP